MAAFDAYKDLFPHAKLTRSQDGVLEVVLHTDGATLVFNGYTHEEFVELFHQIGQDARNRVSSHGSGRGFHRSHRSRGLRLLLAAWLRQDLSRGQKGPCNLLDIPVPVIAALNGPTTVHFRVCASCRYRHCDAGHGLPDKRTSPSGSYRATAFIRSGRSHRSIRGRTFVLTQQILGARGENAGRHQRDRPA